MILRSTQEKMNLELSETLKSVVSLFGIPGSYPSHHLPKTLSSFLHSKDFLCPLASFPAGKPPKGGPFTLYLFAENIQAERPGWK